MKNWQLGLILPLISQSAISIAPMAAIATIVFTTDRLRTAIKILPNTSAILSAWMNQTRYEIVLQICGGQRFTIVQRPIAQAVNPSHIRHDFQGDIVFPLGDADEDSWRTPRNFHFKNFPRPICMGVLSPLVNRNHRIHRYSIVQFIRRIFRSSLMKNIHHATYS